MSAAIPLPPAPDLEHYRKQAKSLLRATRSSDPAALRAWVRRWARSWSDRWIETEAQLRGTSVTPELRDRLDVEIERLEKSLRERKIERLAEAQFFLARAHGFANWADFAKHVQAMQRSASSDAAFEAAADAIVAGDLETLAQLVAEHPRLVHQRSTRAHRSTLLHYVAANGVEDYRQKTPANIVDIAKALLDAGADVHAESKAYGGGATTLDLVATSVHPARAGVQIPLLELLLAHGARIERTPGAAVHSCLANGRAEAAEFLAARGAHLTLEGAAGVGRLEIVRSELEHARKVRADATIRKDIQRAFLWACQFGRNDVLQFLLGEGADVRAPDDAGMTGLHWAAHGGHLETVQLLLRHNAPLEAKNQYGGTVLAQAVWSTTQDARPERLRVIEALVDAGAEVAEDWFTGYREIDEALRRKAQNRPIAETARAVDLIRSGEDASSE